MPPTLSKKFLPLLLSLLLFSCSTFTALQPKSFDQSWSLAMATQTSILQTTTSLLTRKLITKEDATRLLAISDHAGAALDSARTLKGIDLTKATDQLTLATAILDQITVYLKSREQ
jgi:hypothetical protein